MPAGIPYTLLSRPAWNWKAPDFQAWWRWLDQRLGIWFVTDIRGCELNADRCMRKNGPELDAALDLYFDSAQMSEAVRLLTRQAHAQLLKDGFEPVGTLEDERRPSIWGGRSWTQTQRYLDGATGQAIRVTQQLEVSRSANVNHRFDVYVEFAGTTAFRPLVKLRIYETRDRHSSAVLKAPTPRSLQRRLEKQLTRAGYFSRINEVAHRAATALSARLQTTLTP